MWLPENVPLRTGGFQNGHGMSDFYEPEKVSQIRTAALL
jgi:hypothetical protein